MTKGQVNTVSWVYFALACMLLTVAKTFLAKHLLRSLEPLVFVFFDVLISTAFLGFFWQKFDFDSLTPGYVAMLLTVSLPSIAGLTFLSQATKENEVSEVGPLLVLIPALSALVAPFITDDSLSLPGAVGIGIVLVGGYLLKLEDIKDPWGPFRSLGKKSSRAVTLTILIGMVNVNLQKLLVLKSNPETTLFCQQVIISLLAIILAFKNRLGTRALVGSFRVLLPWLVILGAVSAASGLFNLMAYSHGGPVAYVLSIKRLSIVFIAAIGIVALKESARTGKLVGISFMISGCFILAQS